MPPLPTALQRLIDAIAATTPDAWFAQILSVTIAAALAFAVRRALKRLVAGRAALEFDKVRLWPVGLGLWALLMWGGYLIITQGGQSAEPLRLVALAATAFTGVRLALHAVGRTALGWIAAALILVVAVLEAFGLARPVIQALDSDGLPMGDFTLTPWFALKSIAVVGGLFWLAQKIGDLTERSLSREQVLSRSGQVLFAKLMRVALLVFALVFSLGFLGVDVTTLAVLSGAVGLGLGFGLQTVISNYVAGLILLMDKSIKPGDVIEVEFGGGQLRGEVTQLAGRFTAITLRTGVETLIPNQVLISSPVSNWSHTSRNVQIRIPVGVSYSTDLEKAIALCIEAALAAPRVHASPKPVCLVVGFGDSSVDLDVRFWISDAELGVRNVSSGVYLEIWKRFRANNIEIPFPQRDLHVKSWPPMERGGEA